MTLLIAVALLAFVDGCLVTWTFMRDRGSSVVRRVAPYTDPIRISRQVYLRGKQIDEKTYDFNPRRPW